MSSCLATLDERGCALSRRNALIEQHLPVVDSIVNCLLRRRRRVPGFDRDDLIQEGRIGLIRAADTFDSNRGATFVAWVRTCIINALREVGRISIDERDLESLDEYSCEQLVDDSPSPEDAVDARLFLAQSLDHLPLRQREAIERHYLRAQNKTEVARRMDISPQRAGQLLEGGLQNLRRFAESS